jgi:hypothetical protein
MPAKQQTSARGRQQRRVRCGPRRCCRGRATDFTRRVQAGRGCRRLLGLVREIVPPFEGAPPHQQILISAVGTSSAEDVANFVVIGG